MKKFSKFIALTLVCVLFLGAVPVSAANDDTNTAIPISAQVFDDVSPDAWYYEAVNAMGQSGLLAGYSDGLFHPDDPITYGQFATILCRITGISADHSRYIGHTSTHWAAGAIDNICGKTSIFSRGCGDADVQLWRGEALESMACLAAQMPKYNYNSKTQVTEKIWILDDIPDANAIMDWNHDVHVWSKSLVLRAYNLGITTGVDAAGTCNPTGTMTRAQLCQMLYNMGISEPNSVTVRGSGIM